MQSVVYIADVLPDSIISGSTVLICRGDAVYTGMACQNVRICGRIHRVKNHDVMTSIPGTHQLAICIDGLHALSRFESVEIILSPSQSPT